MTAKAAQNDDDTPREPHIELMRVMGRDLRVAIWRAAPPPGQAPGRPLLFFNGVGANIEVMSPLAAWISPHSAWPRTGSPATSVWAKYGAKI